MARILVVEDNPDVRMLTSRMLKAEGHVCVEAEDGREGLTQALRSTSPFDVIVSDIDMPHLTGVGLLHAVRALARGRLRFILISGAWAAWDVVTEAEDPDEFVAFLPKPFGPRELCGLVDEALAVPSGSA